MEIIIQSLGFKASGSLEQLIKEKINAIKDDQIIGANVVLYKGPASNPENDYCEIRLKVPGNDHFVKKHSQYFETSASECINILSQMITKSKEKTGYHRVAKESVITASNGFEDQLRDDVDLEDIVK